MLRRLFRWWWSYRPPVKEPGPPLDPPSLARDTHEAINAYRQRHGRPALKLDACLSHGAAQHAQRVDRGEVRPHDGFLARVDGCGFYRNAGEVVAPWDYESAADAVVGWHRSSGHRAQLLGDFTRCGTGDHRGTYVAIFTK